MGNRISFVTVSLPVAMTDPIDVLRRVAGRDAAPARRAAAPRRWRRCRRFAELLPGGARRVVARAAAARGLVQRRRLQRAGAAGRARAARAPRERDLPRRARSCAGHALSIGALSYRGRLHCGVYADAAVVPDAAEVARDLEAAFDALRIVPRAPDTPWRARAVSRRQRAAKR